MSALAFRIPLALPLRRTWFRGTTSCGRVRCSRIGPYTFACRTLLRPVFWLFDRRCHMSHMLLATLAAIGDSRARSMYDRLRETYNSCRTPHSVDVPPLDEWPGMEAICDDLHCRCVSLCDCEGKCTRTRSLEMAGPSSGARGGSISLWRTSQQRHVVTECGAVRSHVRSRRQLPAKIRNLALPQLLLPRRLRRPCQPLGRSIGILLKSEHMKAFTTLSADATHDSVGLMQPARNPHGHIKVQNSSTSFAHGESVELVPASPPSSCADRNATIECKQSEDLAGGTCFAVAASTSFGSPSYLRSQPDARLNASCGVTGDFARDYVPSLRPSGIGGHHEGVAEPGDDEVAAEDWLEVSYAMLDEVHTS